jgi:hypothetical protein
MTQLTGLPISGQQYSAFHANGFLTSFCTKLMKLQPMKHVTRPFRLDDQLCFSLYAASRAITKAYRPLLEPVGLTHPHIWLCLILWEKAACTVNFIFFFILSDFLLPKRSAFDKQWLIG